MVEVFSFYIKNPLKIKQIEYLWYKSDGNNLLLNFLRKSKGNDKRFKMLSPEIIEEIFKTIFAKPSFYKRKLTFKEFEAIF